MLSLYYAVCISLLCKGCATIFPVKTHNFCFFDDPLIGESELPLFFCSKKRRMSVRFSEHCAVR